MIGRGERGRWLARTMMAGALLLGLPSCSPAGPRPDSTVGVVVRDFRIRASSPTVRAGTVEFQVQDRGPSTHEFVVVRTDLPADQLPLQRDGLTVDEDSPQLHAAGEITDLNIGQSGELVLHLRPGRYVLFCNLEGHYLGGMRAAIEVSGGTGPSSP